MPRLVAVLGLAVFLGIAWAVSTNRKAVPWRLVGWGMGLQLLFGLAILKTPPGEALFAWLSRAFEKLISFTDAGAGLVWGWLYRRDAPPIFLVDLLMTIVFFAALTSVLYHLGVMQKVIEAVARVMRRTMGSSGAETLCAASNIFVGQTEAPLVVRPFLDTMTRSELHAVMTAGFATIAGSVLGAYVQFGLDAGHLVAASFMSAPAALVAAKMFLPETEISPTAGDVRLPRERTTTNVFDAACVGAAEGLKLALTVVAMIVAFVSLIAMLNWGLGALHRLVVPSTTDPVTLQRIFGWLFAPVAWLMGVPWSDCPEIGALLGTRMVLNEFVAYIELAKADVSARAHVVATYAFCGFANFASIAIQIGGIGMLSPARRADLAKLGLRAMLAGTLASFLTACIANVLLSDEQVDRDYRFNRARAARTAEERRREVDVFLEKWPESPYRDRLLKLRDEPLPKRP
ncbi:MAG TPA: NupC/NupG family nucleoside CNT transporter [Planctomycetota bacterium]|nr:NupC/NupG family nucleoside CNT transporter [Planctomycetota bacterium]